MPIFFPKWYENIRHFSEKVLIYSLINVFQYNELKLLGGEKGAADGHVVVQLISKNLFHEKLVSNMTWSGKTKEKNTKKIAFQAFKSIFALISKLLQAADGKFDVAMSQKAITYKVLKYAYRKKPVDVASQQQNHSVNSLEVSTPNETNSKFDQNNQTGDLNAQIHSMAGSSHPFQQRPTITRMQPAFPSTPQHTVINQLMNQAPQLHPPPQFTPYQNQYSGWGGFPNNGWQSQM